jgi:hypothetical protein
VTASGIPASEDRVQPARPGALTVTIEGKPVEGIRGQTLAGVLLASGRLSWRTTSSGGRPRGVFCGIGVCFDCIAEVNGVRDVRLCQRRAVDGDVVEVQHDLLPHAVLPITGESDGADPAADTVAGSTVDQAAEKGTRS